MILFPKVRYLRQNWVREQLYNQLDFFGLQSTDCEEVTADL